MKLDKPTLTAVANILIKERDRLDAILKTMSENTDAAMLRFNGDFQNDIEKRLETFITDSKAAFVDRLGSIEEIISGIENGKDGRDGLDGKDGRNGIDKINIAPRTISPDEKLDKNEVVIYRGGLFQSIRKTTGDPGQDPNSYQVLVNGVAGISYEYDRSERLLELQFRMSDGETFLAFSPDVARGRVSKDDGMADVEGDYILTDTSIQRYIDGGWIEIDIRGEQGKEGPRGRRGLKGRPGITLDDIIVENGHLVVSMTDGTNKAFPIGEVPGLEPEKTHGVHKKAPADPPQDYLWVNPKGEAKIYSGKKWITIRN